MTTWFVRYDRVVVRAMSGGRQKYAVEAESAEEALWKARKRFWLRNPRLVEVFSPTAAAPDPSRGDEGRAWWMERGY